jgi:preprotein translocase subunit YajC
MDPIYKKYFIKVALIWAGCFVLFLFVYMLVLSPQKKSKKQIANQLAEKKRMYESVLKATQEETQIQLNEQIERLQNSLRDFVIDFEDSANLTFDISRIANEKEVASFSIKTKDKEKRGSSAIPDYDYMFENHIDVKFTGGFNQFAGLLNALERHRPVVFVDRFVIARSKRGNLGHEVRMDLAVFVRKRQDG